MALEINNLIIGLNDVTELIGTFEEVSPHAFGNMVNEILFWDYILDVTCSAGNCGNGNGNGNGNPLCGCSGFLAGRYRVIIRKMILP